MLRPCDGVDWIASEWSGVNILLKKNFCSGCKLFYFFSAMKNAA